jgi:hypothetical protein
VTDSFPPDPIFFLGLIAFYSVQIICTMPVKNIKNLCCNDGQPYLGLCLNTGSQLLVYDLQKSLEPQKRFTIPESPQKMLWLRGRFCLGFRDEYTCA